MSPFRYQSDRWGIPGLAQEVSIRTEELQLTPLTGTGGAVARLVGVLCSATVASMQSMPTLTLRHVRSAVVRLSRPQAGWPPPALRVFRAAFVDAAGWLTVRSAWLGVWTAVARLQAMRLPLWVPWAVDEPAPFVALPVGPSRVCRTFDLPADPTASRIGRHHARIACADWGMGAVAEDAVLIASELVANAVDHARTVSRLSLELHGTDLRLEVRDFRPGGRLHAQPVDVTAPRGRGLLIIESISQRWGVTEHPDGKTVWAVLTGP